MRRNQAKTTSIRIVSRHGLLLMGALAGGCVDNSGNADGPRRAGAEGSGGVSAGLESPAGSPSAGGRASPASGGGTPLGFGGSATIGFGGSTPQTGSAAEGPDSAGSAISLGTGGKPLGGDSGDDPISEDGARPQGANSAVQDVPAGSVCARLSEAQCNAEANCCSSPGRAIDACKTAMARKCAELYLDDVSKSPSSGYSPHATGLALREFQRQAESCDPHIVTWGASVSGLRGIFPGTRNRGADCTPPNLLDPGGVAAQLMSCTNPDETACLPSAAAWTCTARAAAGGACFSDTNCQDGFFCDNPRTALLGATCQVRKANGSSCTAGGQCASLVCQRSACVPADAQSVYCLRDG